jgi:hypothetical protein
MARLPQIVKQKTGLADGNNYNYLNTDKYKFFHLGTVDDEFKELNLTYVRIKQDTTKFLNECISYKAAMLSKFYFDD